MARIGMHTKTNARGANNQDSCLVRVARTSVGEVSCAIVCDGVGGFDAGEIASGSVVTRFARWFDEELPEYVRLNVRQGTLDLTGIKKEWAALLRNCNDALYKEGATSERRLATTFTGVFAHKGMYVTAQVGDSRCYLVMQGEIRALTSDQTIATLAVSQGRLSAKEAETHPDRHVLIQALGSQNGISPEFAMGSFPPGAAFVVCSDGFYEPLEMAEIGTAFAPVLSAEDLVIENACENAVLLGSSRGETDDATVVCLAMDAWTAGAMSGSEEDSEAATSLIDAVGDLRDDGENATVLLEPETTSGEHTGDTGSATEASTASGLRGFSLDAPQDNKAVSANDAFADVDFDEEATLDSLEAGED